MTVPRDPVLLSETDGRKHGSRHPLQMRALVFYALDDRSQAATIHALYY